MPQPLITAVVVTHNSECDVRELLRGLADPRVQVVVVDNASSDSSADVAAAAGADVTRLPFNVGWSRGCNIGAARSAAPVLAFVNPDARPSAAHLVRLAAGLGGSVAAVSPRFMDPDGAPQSFYFRFPDPWSGLFCFLSAGHRIDRAIGSPFIRHRTYDFRTDGIPQVDQPGAACLLIAADCFRAFGGFDDDMFLFFGDTDLCRRLRDQHLQVAVAWDVEVVHRGGGSVLQLPRAAVHRQLQRDYLVYLRKHHGPAAAALTKVAVVFLTGLLPALTRLLRGRARDAAAQLLLAVQVLR